MTKTVFLIFGILLLCGCDSMTSSPNVDFPESYKIEIDSAENAKIRAKAAYDLRLQFREFENEDALVEFVNDSSNYDLKVVEITVKAVDTGSYILWFRDETGHRWSR